MKIRPFELTLVVGFGILMALALVLLRSVNPEKDESTLVIGGPVTIWGTIGGPVFEEVLGSLRGKNREYLKVTYEYVPEEEFDQRFVNALADGTPPDLVLISHEELIANRRRVEAIPYTSFPLPDFRGLYVDGADIFALGDGIYGYPIAIDPLLMYWNRDLLSQNNMLTPPATWEQLVNEVVPELTVRDFNRTISQSAVALGEYDNVTNAKAILSTLLLQGGSRLVEEEQGSYRVRLDTSVSVDTQARPYLNALRFLTNFNSVSNTLYSWNRTKPQDEEAFLREELALYFGYASEGKILERKNPNLNFDVAPVPQGAEATVKRTYGKFYALMVPRGAKNKLGAYQVMLDMSAQEYVKQISDALGLVPVYRSSVAAGSNDVYGRVAYSVVPTTRAWLSPRRSETDAIFRQALEATRANPSNVANAAFESLRRFENAY